MNAPFRPPTTAFKTADAATVWAKVWKSDCLDSIAQLESHIGLLLNALDGRAHVFDLARTGPPTRPSFDSLRDRLKAKGHWKAERKAFDDKLEAFAAILDFRCDVAHGALQVWQGSEGEWLLTLRHAQGHCAGPLRWYALPFDEADKMRQELRQHVAMFIEGAASLAQKSRATA